MTAQPRASQSTELEYRVALENRVNPIPIGVASTLHHYRLQYFSLANV